jgi:hypothetical protein
MARFTGIRRTLVQGASAFGAALLLWTSAPGMARQSAHASPMMRQSIYAALIGTWLGPGLADTGGCGTEYGQFTFFRNQQYAYTSNSQDCGGFTNVGYYRIQNGVLTIHWTRCNFPCAPGTASVRFSFLTYNAFELLDLGRAYTYYRQ